MAKKQTEAPKRKGRPPGSKSKLPFVTFPEALNYSKMLWDKAQYNEMSFNDVSSLMKLHEKKCTRVLGTLKDYYGVIEKTDQGSWRLTEAGKRVVRGDPLALKEVFSKNQMFSDLYQNFGGDRKVMDGVILEYINKSYKGVDAEEVKRRLLEGVKIIKDRTMRRPPELTEPEVSQDFVLPLFQLRYALRPPSDAEIENLVEKVVEKLSKSSDDVLKLISELMTEKKDDRKEVANLLDRAMKKLNLGAPEGVEEEKTQSD